MIKQNKMCYRKPNKMLDGAIFVLNPREKNTMESLGFFRKFNAFRI